MLKPARSERTTLTEIAEQELRQAITHGTFRRGSQLPPEAELCQALEKAEQLGAGLGKPLVTVGRVCTADGRPVVYSREYHLPDAFDFIIWRRGPTKLRGVFSEDRS